MGACCSTNSTDKNDKNRKNYKPEIKVHQNNNEDSVEMGRKYKTDKNSNETNFHKLLETGDIRIVDIILSKGNDINEYIFESNTENLILSAVRVSSNPELIHSIIKKGGNINSEQTENGYTPIVSACIDLKEEIVKALLEYNPKFTFFHKESKENKDVIVFLKEFLIEHKYAKKSALTNELKVKYNKIEEMLKNYQFRNGNVEKLDDDRKELNARENGTFNRM